MRRQQSLLLAHADNEVNDRAGKVGHEADARRDRILVVGEGELASIVRHLLHLGDGALLGHLDITARVRRRAFNRRLGSLLGHGDAARETSVGKERRREDLELRRPGLRQILYEYIVEPFP